MKIIQTCKKLEVGSGDGCEMAVRVTYTYMGTAEEIAKVEKAIKGFGSTTVAEVNIIS